MQETPTYEAPPAYNPEVDIVYEVDDKVQAPPPTESGETQNQVQNPHTKRELRGAAVAGGLAGLVLGGPIIGAVAAGGAALAVSSKGQAGKMARSCGEATASVGDRLKKIDKKHHVMEKTGKGITKGCNWVAKKVKPRDASS